MKIELTKDQIEGLKTRMGQRLHFLQISTPQDGGIKQFSSNGQKSAHFEEIDFYAEFIKALEVSEVEEQFNLETIFVNFEVEELQQIKRALTFKQNKIRQTIKINAVMRQTLKQVNATKLLITESNDLQQLITKIENILIKHNAL